MHIFLQLGGGGRDCLRCRQHRIRVAPRLAHRAGNLVEHGDNYLGSLGGVRHVTEDFAGGGILLLQGIGNRRRESVNLLQAIAVTLDGRNSDASGGSEPP